MTSEADQLRKIADAVETLKQQDGVTVQVDVPEIEALISGSTDQPQIGETQVSSDE